MRKLITAILVLATSIVFCQKNKHKETIEDTIKSFSNEERRYEGNVKLKLLVEDDASCIIKSNNTVILEEGFIVKEGTFYILPDDGTMVKKKIKENIFTIYPNPGSNMISISSNKELILNVELTSLDGKSILKTEPEPTALFNLDVSSLSNGIYIIIIETTNHESIVQKFIKE